MRVLFDISTLGLGELYDHSKGGSYRATERLFNGLTDFPDVDLLLCANHSSVAYHGGEAYLRRRQTLSKQLVGGATTTRATSARSIMAAAHRITRRALGSNVLPAILRRVATLIDSGVHRSISDTSPPADIFHSPGGAPLPPQSNNTRHPKRILTIYDVTPLRFPSLYERAYTRAVWTLLRSVRDGDFVITSSEYTRAELNERGVGTPDRTFVIPLAADPTLFFPCRDNNRLQEIRRKYNIPSGPYILSVNTLDPRKNSAAAIEALRRVREEGLDDLSLVLVGYCGQKSVERDNDTSTTRASRVIVTGFMPDQDLAAIYSGATAFVYTSFDEGFGLTPLEAMQCGVPVIASKVGAIPEVVGDAGILIDLDDKDALCHALLDVCRNDSLRQRLASQSLQQASTFSWARTIEQTVAAYRAACLH